MENKKIVIPKSVFKQHMSKADYKGMLKMLEENNITEITQEVILDMMARKMYQLRKVNEKLKDIGIGIMVMNQTLEYLDQELKSKLITPALLRSG